MSTCAIIAILQNAASPAFQPLPVRHLPFIDMLREIIYQIHPPIPDSHVRTPVPDGHHDLANHALEGIARQISDVAEFNG
jgi:hypothetical protein